MGNVDSVVKKIYSEDELRQTHKGDTQLLDAFEQDLAFTTDFVVNKFLGDLQNNTRMFETEELKFKKQFSSQKRKNVELALQYVEEEESVSMLIKKDLDCLRKEISKLSQLGFCSIDKLLERKVDLLKKSFAALWRREKRRGKVKIHTPYLFVETS
jgi:hypothetical protein